MIGTKLSDRYEILRELGRGGMGVVYLANDPVLEREVAVKVVTPEHISPESVERFKREARVVAKMDHPAIVSVYDSGQHERSLFFVMPFVEGTNLRVLLRQQSLRLGELIDIGVQIAEALDYSHSRGVIHRDIKPENIMVTRRDAESIRVRVTDFGLAMASSQEHITKTATIVGTVAYMSPEQVAGRELDARSDIYSLGTVLYECLVGQTPFSGEVQALIYRISHEIPLPPKSVQAEVDEEVEDILMRCLEKEPAKRPTGKEVADTLSNYRLKLQGSGRHRVMLPSSMTMSFQFQRPTMRPFVGREKEFADLQKRLNAAIAGECQFVLVAGEAGIGKSRLLEELENLARVREISVFHGRFVEIDHALPYQGFCEAIQEYFHSRTTSSSVTPADFSDLASDLMALFPVLSETKELAARSGEKSLAESGSRKFEDRAYIFELLARTLTRIAAGKPFLLFLEDLHSADVSIEALDYIVRRLGPTPTLIVGTYRSTDIDKRHRITKLLSGFKGDRRFGLIQLGPLSPSGHRLFLEKLIGGAGLEEVLVQKFYEATEGNPYFTAELVRSLLDSGGIVKDESGYYKLSSETVISIEELPVTIQQTVQERIERLPEQQREVLSIASVLGKTFEFSDLEYLATEHENLESAVELLIRSGFIEEDRQSRTDRFTFSSGVVRDVLYTSLPRRKRRALHRKHAEELERRNEGRLERVYAQLFDHYAQADVPEKVIEYGFLLARKSLQTFSLDDAIRVVHTVLDFLEEDPANRSAKAEAKTLLASAYRMSGNIPASLKELEEAINIFEKEKQTTPLLAAILSAAEIAWQGLKVEEARRWAEKGLNIARSSGDKSCLARLLSLGATVANLRGEYMKAQAYLEEAEQLKPRKEQGQEEVPGGGRLEVAMLNPCQAKHPANAAFNEEVEVFANVFETLVDADAQGTLIPHLCERWETLNDGALFLFVLRKEVRLHDGRRLTAQDAKVSLENSIRRASQALPPGFAAIQGVQSFLNGSSEQVSGIVTLSDNIIEIQLLNRLPIYPALLTDVRTAIAAQSKSGETSLVGTGPFRLVSLKSDSIVLERNTEYWKGTSSLLDAIEFRVVASSAEAAEGFRSGKYDVVRDLLPQDVEEIFRDSRLGANLVEAPQKDVYFVLFNNNSPMGRIPALREALARLGQMNDLVTRTLGRFAQPAEGLLPPGILGHDPGRRRHSISREKAADLIESTSLPRPIRLRAAVHPIFQDRYSAFLTSLFEIWSEIGIEVAIRTPDVASYNEAWTRNEEIDLLIGRWIADYDDPDTFAYGLFHSEIGEFRHYYSSKEIDQRLEEARSERQPEVREDLYRKIENDLMETGVFIPLFHDIDYRIAAANVRRLALSSNPPFVNYSEISKTQRISPVPAEKMERGLLTIPLPGLVENLDPGLGVTSSHYEVSPMIFETLTYVAEGARIIPWLASSFQAEEGGRRFRFHLRHGVRFHDGRRLTARDVRYSFERLLQNQQSESRSLLSPIRGAKEILKGQSRELHGFQILSALEFVLELEEPVSFFPALLSNQPAAIVPEGTDQFLGTWREGSIGTGPFRVARFEPGRMIELEANPGYWRSGYPRTDRIEFVLGVSPAEVLSGFRSGRYSIATNLMPADAEALLREPEFAASYREMPSLQTSCLFFNINRKPCSEQEFRQRVVQAIDVESLVHRNFGRLAVPAHTLTPPNLLAYEREIRTTPVTRMNGSKEEVELAVTYSSSYGGKYSTFLKDLFKQLNQSGFQTRVTSVQQYVVEASGSDIGLANWIADYPDADNFIGLLDSKSGFYGRFCGTPEIDLLIEKSRTETNVAARHSIYRQIEEIERERCYLLPLFHDLTYCFGRPEIEGLDLNFFSALVPYEKLSIRR